MKLSHVKIKRRRADTARRIRRFVELAQLCPPGMVDWQKLADRYDIPVRFADGSVS